MKATDDMDDPYLALAELLIEQTERSTIRLRDYGSFKRYCWDEIHFPTVRKILLARDEPVIGLKGIAFAGLTAWIVAPNQDRNLHVKDAVCIELARKLVEIEGGMAENDGGIPSARQLALEFGDRTSLLYEHVYYAIGGMRSLLECSSPEDHMILHQRHARGIREIVQQTAAFHFVHDERQDLLGAGAPAEQILDQPSRKRLIPKIKCLDFYTKKFAPEQVDWNFHEQSPATMGRYHRDFRPATALLYAAAMIRQSGKQSLLTRMIKRTIRSEGNEKLLERWFSMAAYVQKHVLADCRPPNSYEDFDFMFDSVDPIPFANPIENEEDRSHLRRIFTRSVKGRRSTT